MLLYNYYKLNVRIDMSDKPSDVTPENWGEKSAEGFKWKQNIDSWQEHRVSFGEWHMKQNEQLGEGNILIGTPANEQGVPDSSLPNSDDMVGIYIKSS